MKRPRTVFVLGAQRSGTTAFSLALGKHSDVALTVNGKLLYYLIVWCYRNPLALLDGHARLDEIAFSLNRKAILGIDTKRQAQLRANLEEPATGNPSSAAELVRRLWWRAYRDVARGKTVIGDKYNEYLLQLPEIGRIFPDAQFIFLHRDPYEVAESMVRRFVGRPWAPRTRSAALRKWATWNAQWIRFRSRLPKERRLEVAYAELVDRPAEIFKRTVEFLQLRPTPAFLRRSSGTISKPAHHAGARRRPTGLPGLFDEVCGQLGYD